MFCILLSIHLNFFESWGFGKGNEWMNWIMMCMATTFSNFGLNVKLWKLMRWYINFEHYVQMIQILNLNKIKYT